MARHIYEAGGGLRYDVEGNAVYEHGTRQQAFVISGNTLFGHKSGHAAYWILDNDLHPYDHKLPKLYFGDD